MIVDCADKAGGLAGTDVTDEGFLYDVGGLVVQVKSLLLTNIHQTCHLLTLQIL